MGHIRLGRLPASKQWKEVVGLIAGGGAAAALASATADAAEGELTRSQGDPVLQYAVWLLTQLPIAAQTEKFSEHLIGLGFQEGAEQSPFALVSGFSTAIDRNIDPTLERSDLGELARKAGAECLLELTQSGTHSLFNTPAQDLQLALGRYATKERFGRLARAFFARLTARILEYYLSRELPNHVGPDKALASLSDQIEIQRAIGLHCRESAKIVEVFAGGWFSKHRYQDSLTLESANAFTAYALKKMREELRARRQAHE